MDRKEGSRHISPAVRDAVYKRDGGRCTFVGADGRRCNSKWDLEIHHDDVPYARGGSNSVNNLTLLCAAHNKLKAERVYGKCHMQRYDRKTGKGDPGDDNDKHWSVRGQNVSYVWGTKPLERLLVFRVSYEKMPYLLSCLQVPLT
jgi:hypothetical protein